ncbi:MAG: restriction endonuclease subunit S [Candidatus Nomurabacteria bacterium]|nr:restriction endonuclease subunit S [Candidatus Nomurabacteria bacterium]USN87259.1 MAG: restriction endonuclease subunit S [Candidatus Nomurabacteria bacterium]
MKKETLVKGWSRKKLGDVLKIGSGKDHKHLKDGDIPVFGTGGLMRHVDTPLHEGETVFIGRKGTINKPFYYNGKFWTVDTLFYTYNFKDTTAKYINYVFQKINWLKYNEASGVPSLSKTTIEKIPFDFPPTAEQEKIVSILTTWDCYINELQRTIRKKEQTKKGLLEEVLNERIKVPGSKSEWKTYTISQLGVTFTGLTGKSKDDFGFGTPYVTYMNVFSNSKIHPDQYGLVSIQKGEKQNYLEYGDLIFTTSSETPQDVGMSSVFLDESKNKVLLNSFCFGFRPKQNILEPRFARFLFRGKSFRKHMFRIAQGVSRYNLSKNQFLQTKVSLPENTDDQIKIAEIFETCELELENLKDKLKLVREQRKYLLENLVHGNIRTVKSLSATK